MVTEGLEAKYRIDADLCTDHREILLEKGNKTCIMNHQKALLQVMHGSPVHVCRISDKEMSNHDDCGKIVCIA